MSLRDLPPGRVNASGVRALRERVIDVSSSPTVERPWLYDPELRPGDGNLRYRLAVLAQDVRDVVRHAGGWLFDLSKAGWDVTVLLLGQGETRPIRILGLNVIELNRSGLENDRHPYPQMLAVAPDLLAQDPHVNRRIIRMVRTGLTDVVLYGVSQLDESRGDDVLLHKLTRAARVFKARSLAVDGASEDDSADDVESFQRLRPPRALPLEGATRRPPAGVMSLAFGSVTQRAAYSATRA